VGRWGLILRSRGSGSERDSRKGIDCGSPFGSGHTNMFIDM